MSDQHIGPLSAPLSPEELRILSFLSGAEDGREWSYEEVASRFGIGVERVRDVAQSGIAKLRSTNG